MDADGAKNGTVLSSVAPLVNRQLVQLLESALNDAKAGRVRAGGVVAVVGPGQFMAFASFEGAAAEVIAGCEAMKFDVIEKMRTPRSNILRAMPR